MLPGIFRAASRGMLIAVMACISSFQLGFAKAQAQETGRALLERAKSLYDELEYEEALTVLRHAAESGDLSRRDLVEVYKHKGFIHLILGEEEHAEASFKRLLQHAPDHRLNPILTPPRFIDFFDSVRSRARADAPVLFEHKPPGVFDASKPLEVVAFMIDRGGMVDRLKVYFRLQERGGNYSSAELKVDSVDSTRYAGAIPYVFGDQSDRFVIEYYLAALASDGAPLATYGEPGSPIEVVVDVRDGFLGPRYSKEADSRRWWLWAGAIGAVGLTSGLIILGLQSSPDPPDHGAATLIVR